MDPYELSPFELVQRAYKAFSNTAAKVQQKHSLRPLKADEVAELEADAREVLQY